MTCKTTQLADFLGISPRRVQQLTQAGILEKGPGGYDLKEAVNDYGNYKIECATARGPSDKDSIAAEHEKVKTDIDKLRLRELRKNTFDAAAVTASWHQMVKAFSCILKSKVVPMAEAAAAAPDINGKIDAIDGILKEALEEMANYDPADWQQFNEYQLEENGGADYFPEDSDE